MIYLCAESHKYAITFIQYYQLQIKINTLQNMYCYLKHLMLKMYQCDILYIVIM